MMKLFGICALIMKNRQKSKSLSILYLTALVLLFGMPMQARAGLFVHFTTDQAEWDLLVKEEQSYAFTRSNVENADEVVRTLVGDNIFFLGGAVGSEVALSTLTFPKAATGLPVDFVFTSTQATTGAGSGGSLASRSTILTVV